MQQSIIVKSGDIPVAYKMEKYRLWLTFIVIDENLWNFTSLALVELLRYAKQVKIPLQYYTIRFCGWILYVFFREKNQRVAMLYNSKIRVACISSPDNQNRQYDIFQYKTTKKS